MVNTDIASIRKFKDNMLTTPKSIRRDYTRLLNFMVVRGAGTLVNERFKPTLILTEKDIVTNSDEFYADSQPSPIRSYLRIMITNPTGSEKGGFVTINGGDGNMNELTESFFLWVKAGQAQVHYTNNRYGTLSGASLKAFVTQGWAGGARSR
jgi:hypothetical protein